MKKIRGSLCFAATLAALILPPALPAQHGVSLTTEAFQEVAVTGKSGKKEKKTVPLGRVVPGSEVIYVIRYENRGAQPAEQVVINNALPKELTYKSAAGAAGKFEVSVDGGASYGVLPSLRVTGADGKARAAEAADVTHLRWSLAGAVAPGGTGSVSYRAVVK